MSFSLSLSSSLLLLLLLLLRYCSGCARVHTSVLVQGVLELRDGRWHLQALVQNLSLALKADVLGPADEAREVAARREILADAKVARSLLKERDRLTLLASGGLATLGSGGLGATLLGVSAGHNRLDVESLGRLGLALAGLLLGSLYTVKREKSGYAKAQHHQQHQERSITRSMHTHTRYHRAEPHHHYCHHHRPIALHLTTHKLPLEIIDISSVRARMARRCLDTRCASIRRRNAPLR